MTWERFAVCRPDDEPLLFARENLVQRMAIQRICIGRGCPVVEECGEAAGPTRYGVWGALTAGQRRTRRERGFKRRASRA